MSDRVRLGSTGLSVSRIGLGCEPLGGTDWGRVDEREAADAVRRALDLGVNLFDTADVYGLGRSEERLAAALGAKRHDVVIVTKFGISWRQEPDGGRAATWKDASPARAREAVEGSLRRLRLDAIPVWLVHWPDPATPVERTLEAMTDLQREGKVVHIGLSNFPAAELERALGLAPITVVELPYSLLAREAETDLLPLAGRAGIGVLAYGVLAQGLLSGKYGGAATFAADDRRHRLPQFAAANSDGNAALLARVRGFGEPRGLTASQTAIGWVLGHDDVSCALVGAKTSSQVEENVHAATRKWTDMDRAYLATGAKAG